MICPTNPVPNFFDGILPPQPAAHAARLRAHFITFCTKFRRILPESTRDIVLGCCIHDYGRRYRLEVAVVMPDHVHLILTPLPDEARRTIKGASAHAINRQMGHQGPIWQEESFD
jgi:REP element-mobilizing transposase RayT